MKQAQASYTPHFDPGKPTALQRQIHRDWLVLDPDMLKRHVVIEEGGVVPHSSITTMTEQFAPCLWDAFACWLGIHGAPLDGTWITDWNDFLRDLQNARARAQTNGFQMPSNGIIWDSSRRF